jgi:hypothetical protein
VRVGGGRGVSGRAASRRAALAVGAAALLLGGVGCGDRGRSAQVEAPGGAGNAAVAFDPGPVPAEFAGGERLFNANCARCHGQLALGTGQGPPLVHRIYEPNHHGDAAFLFAVARGVPQHHWSFGNMPPVAGLDQTAVEQITGYVRWLQRQAGIY